MAHSVNRLPLKQRNTAKGREEPDKRDAWTKHKAKEKHGTSEIKVFIALFEIFIMHIHSSSSGGKKTSLILSKHLCWDTVKGEMWFFFK